MERKAGFLTVHCSKNPGASLQAHALAKKMSTFIEDITLIDYCPSYFLDPMDIEKRKEWSVKDKLKNILIGRAQQKRHDLFVKFQDEFLPPKTKRYNSPDELTGEELGFTHYICGSDQIWNPQHVRYDDTFFFDFVGNAQVKKVSYAASIGQDQLNDVDKAYLKKGLSNMDAVSIREKDGVALVKNEFHVNAEQNIDPTLLYPGEYWKTLEKAPDTGIPEKYVLYYPIHNSELSGALLKYYKKKSHLPCVAVDGGVKKYKNVDIQMRSYGPCEFLWMLDHAEYVVTNSFHGTVLSILLNKKVISFKHKSRNSRLSNVLDLLDLRELQVDSVEQAERIDWDNIAKKYLQLDVRLLPEREKALDYLARVLE